MSISRKIFPALLCLAVAVLSGCNEEIEVHTKSMDRSYLVVEGMLTA